MKENKENLKNGIRSLAHHCTTPLRYQEVIRHRIALRRKLGSEQEQAEGRGGAQNR